MLIQFDVANTEEQFEQILQLQRQNLMGAVSAEQQAREGFVYAKHTVPLLKTMSAHLPQVVAIQEGRVVGYNLAMHAAMSETVPSLIPMFSEFEKCQYKGKSLKDYHFIVGGQVCVARAFRGQGLLKKLYQATSTRVPQDYQLCVTEIAVSNAVSLSAHQKLGFEIIRTYNDGETDWHIVAWEMCRPQSDQSSERHS